MPKHFFVREIIEERKPLAATARRAGRIGCNILLNQIPDSGKIFFVREGQLQDKEKVPTINICENCDHTWSDLWSAMCDDDCPHCGERHMSPFKSEEVSDEEEDADSGRA